VPQSAAVQVCWSELLLIGGLEQTGDAVYELGGRVGEKLRHWSGVVMSALTFMANDPEPPPRPTAPSSSSSGITAGWTSSPSRGWRP
jgi:hypothetical protein